MYFNSSVVMLVFLYIFEIDAVGNYQSQKVYWRLLVRLCYILGSHCDSSHIDPVLYNVIQFD